MPDREPSEGRSAEDWVSAFAAELGMDSPAGKRMGAILKLAAVAAHASERTAAPVACWLAGASGRGLDELIELADRVSRDD